MSSHWYIDPELADRIQHLYDDNPLIEADELRAVLEREGVLEDEWDIARFLSKLGRARYSRPGLSGPAQNVGWVHGMVHPGTPLGDGGILGFGRPGSDGGFSG